MFEKIIETLNEKPYFHWSITACLGLLLILIIIAIVVKIKEKRVYRKKPNYIEEAMLKEIEETSVLEETTKNETLTEEETIIEEIPEEQTVVEDASNLEEVKETPVKKTKVHTPKQNAAETKKTRVVYGKYEVYSDGTSFYYNLKASNGELLIKSEAYATKDSVLLAIAAIKRNVEVGTISVREDKHGLYQFVLIARNHRTLVMSANYPTEKRAQSASESFKRFAANSPVVELEEIVESDREEVILENITDKKGGKIGVVSSDSGFYYMLKASNGEVLVHSNFYKTELSAQNAMARFKEAVFDGKFYIEKDKRNNYQFKLYAKGGRIICVGHIYATKSLAISSVNSVCSFVKLATNI